MGKNNVNTDHYKERGRERQGEDIVQEENRREYAENEPQPGRAGSRNFIPGAAPVGQPGKKSTRGGDK